MKKKCELCSGLARMYCESDQASLCWSCDFKVHAANFLVARHLRTLLCHVCQSPTPWTATGTKLGPTVSVCDKCCLRSRNHLDDGGEEVDVNESEEEEAGEQEDDNKENDNEDFQVVPWSPTAPPPPPSSSSYSDEEASYSSSSASSSLASSPRDRKRMRKNASDPGSHENRYCIDLNKPPEMVAKVVASRGGGGGRPDCVDSSSNRNLKRRRRESGRIGMSGSKSWAVVGCVERLQKQEMGSPSTIADLCRLSEDEAAVDESS